MKTMEQPHSHPALTVITFIGMTTSFIVATVQNNVEISMRFFSFTIGVCCSFVIIVSHWDKFRKNIGQFWKDVKHIFKRNK